MINLRVAPIVNPMNINEIYTLISSTSNETINKENSSIVLPKLLVDSAQFKSDIINTLHNLIYFETIKTNFSAKFPPCWTTISPEQQQQRKHPHHALADPINYTKSWKFVNNCGK